MRRWNRKKWRYVAVVVLIIWAFGHWGNDGEKGEQDSVSAGEKMMADLCVEKVTEEILPFFSYVQEKEKTGGSASVLGERLLQELPVFGYLEARAGDASAWREEEAYAALHESEDDGETDLGDPALEGNGQYIDAELVQAMEQENGVDSPETEDRSGEGDALAGENQLDIEALIAENQMAQGIFVPHEQISTYDWQTLSEYQTLVSTFYAIDAGTMIGSDQLDVEKLMGRDLTISKSDPSPQILIYHTHSLEAFADSVPGDRSQTIVGVGDRLAQILSEQYGYGVIHHTEEYDTVRDDAYANSLPAIKQLLEDNPSIQVIIDLHRDSGVAGTRRAIELDGRPTATFMLFNGLSRTKKTGDIEYLKNPNLDDNLAFSFQMQVKAGEYYPGLTRKIYLKGYRYNMHLLPRTLLIELGDSNSTVEEAMNTCDPLAHILDMVLSGE